MNVTLVALPSHSDFRLASYVEELHAIEIKQTDIVTVLTTADHTGLTWSSFCVSDLN